MPRGTAASEDVRNYNLKKENRVGTAILIGISVGVGALATGLSEFVEGEQVGGLPWPIAWIGWAALGILFMIGMAFFAMLMDE